MLRTSVIAVGSVRHSVRIHNLSLGGAMIEDANLVPGSDVIIESVQGEALPRRVPWAARAGGQEFAHPISLARLNTATIPARRVA